MKRLILGLLVVLLVIGMVACAEAERVEPVPAPSPAPMPAPEGSGRDNYKGVVVESPPPIINIPEPAPAPTPAPAPIDEGSSQEWSGERLIIRSAYMTLVVVDIDSAIAQITNLAANYDGFVVSSNVWQDNDRTSGSISIRVTSDRFSEVIQALRSLAVEVRAESTSGEDVTEEYVDLSAKLRNLEAAEAQLLKLMEQAGDVSDILEVQRELVDTREDIERTRGRMQYLEQSAAMSLIQIQLEQSKLTAELNASTRTVKEGEKVQFFSIVAGGFTPYSYEWDFGDGETSTEANPVHSYDSDGDYTVNLKVTDDRGNVAPYEREDYITVLPGWDAGGIAGAAWNGLVGFFRILANVLIWVGIFIPLWIIIGVILYFTWWRKRKKRQ